MLDVLAQDYMPPPGQGLTWMKALFKHALRTPYCPW
jgi:hypothetical protein